MLCFDSDKHQRPLTQPVLVTRNTSLYGGTYRLSQLEQVHQWAVAAERSDARYALVAQSGSDT